MDWVVVRNRVQHVDARNQRRIDQALTGVSAGSAFGSPRAVGRVIYRELFPLQAGASRRRDSSGNWARGHLVARQELRELVANLRLPVAAGASRAA